MKCADCYFYERSETSIFGGWCLNGAHLREKKNTSMGVDKDDYCKDWEAKDESTEKTL
ncbi:MAG: hypothetical protein K5779_00880 [Saccharofermentans sp.]|nr:hypothetical protein [Saccharofermentans sp.]